MRLLIISAHLFTRRVSSGGDRSMLELVRAAIKDGLEVTMVTVGGTSKDFSNAGATILEVYPSGIDFATRYPVALPALLILARILPTVYAVKELEADVIYTPGDFLCNIIPAQILAKKKGIPWFTDVHHIIRPHMRPQGGSWVLNMVAWQAQQLSLRIIRNGVTTVLSHNLDVYRYFRERDMEENRLSLIGNSLDIDTIQSTMPIKTEFDACFIGRLNLTKGFLDLPEIWSQVVQSHPDARLAIIGTGGEALSPLKSQFLKDAQSRGVQSNISLLGYLDDATKYGILKSTRLLISPSYEEGWGMVVGESLACGIPVAAYELPVYEEIFPGAVETGPVKDKAGLAKAVLRLMDDQNLAKTRVEHGQNMVLQYSAHRVTADIIRLMKVAVRSGLRMR